MKSFWKLLAAIVICQLTGIISSFFTVDPITTWYAFLNKPPFNPPNWIFAPVWTTLYLLMGISAFLIWQKGLTKKKVKQALFYFLVQLLLNFLWSILFFGLQSPLLGLIDIIILLVFIVVTTMKFYNISKPAAYLLIPYLLWVSFATILNLSILILNP